jgi:hypothetical protein
VTPSRSFNCRQLGRPSPCIELYCWHNSLPTLCFSLCRWIVLVLVLFPLLSSLCSRLWAPLSSLLSLLSSLFSLLSLLLSPLSFSFSLSLSLPLVSLDPCLLLCLQPELGRLVGVLVNQRLPVQDKADSDSSQHDVDGEARRHGLVVVVVDDRRRPQMSAGSGCSLDPTTAAPTGTRSQSNAHTACQFFGERFSRLTSSPSVSVVRAHSLSW